MGDFTSLADLPTLGRPVSRGFESAVSAIENYDWANIKAQISGSQGQNREIADGMVEFVRDQLEPAVIELNEDSWNTIKSNVETALGGELEKEIDATSSELILHTIRKHVEINVKAEAVEAADSLETALRATTALPPTANQTTPAPQIHSELMFDVASPWPGGRR